MITTKRQQDNNQIIQEQINKIDEHWTKVDRWRKLPWYIKSNKKGTVLTFNKWWCRWQGIKYVIFKRKIK